ncbi:Uncharacterized protein Fot_20038 [Forsythia ovata]|uniref:Uncharacterized protein n=1 Tax=Forsythia ovata TaxID=205694 RepID=A0ABD1VMS0_9LAMI
MNYLSILADYSNILSDILANSTPLEKNSLPESLFGFSGGNFGTVDYSEIRLVYTCSPLQTHRQRRKVAPSYREFYNAHLTTVKNDQNLRYVIKFAHEDVEHRLSNIFFGTV